jgi:hypothetical protein
VIFAGSAARAAALRHGCPPRSPGKEYPDGRVAPVTNQPRVVFRVGRSALEAPSPGVSIIGRGQRSSLQATPAQLRYRLRSWPRGSMKKTLTLRPCTIAQGIQKRCESTRSPNASQFPHPLPRTFPRKNQNTPRLILAFAPALLVLAGGSRTARAQASANRITRQLT